MKKRKDVPLVDNANIASMGDVARMLAQVDALGGTLHFAVTKDTDGWSAICEEAAGIVAGGPETDPIEEVIEHQIREAICTAFHLQTEPAPDLFKAQVTGVALSFA